VFAFRNQIRLSVPPNRVRLAADRVFLPGHLQEVMHRVQMSYPRTLLVTRARTINYAMCWLPFAGCDSDAVKDQSRCDNTCFVQTATHCKP
jgi:hypothetical protein